MFKIFGGIAADTKRPVTADDFLPKSILTVQQLIEQYNNICDQLGNRDQKDPSAIRLAEILCDPSSIQRTLMPYDPPTRRSLPTKLIEYGEQWRANPAHKKIVQLTDNLCIAVDRNSYGIRTQSPVLAEDSEYLPFKINPDTENGFEQSINFITKDGKMASVQGGGLRWTMTYINEKSRSESEKLSPRDAAKVLALIENFRRGHVLLAPGQEIELARQGNKIEVEAPTGP